MRIMQSKTLAVLMVCVTTIGLLLSLFFLIQIWRYRRPVTTKFQSIIIQTSAILQTTGQGLDIIDQVVINIYTSTQNLEDTTNALALTVQSTNQFIDSAGTFMGEDLITTITNTQRTLDSAQSSALVIDNIMTILSRVPLIGIDYNPSLPLNDALGKVSDSLDPIQVSLKGFQSTLDTTRTNMQTFKDQILVLSQNISAINTNLASSQAVINDYHSQVSSMESWMDRAKNSLPNWVNTLCWLLTLIILWLLMIQTGILLHGIYILANHQSMQERQSSSGIYPRE